MAESLLIKHQLLISSRARRRAPNLNSFDRFVLGLGGSLFVPASRIPKLAVILKPRTLLRSHEALKKRKFGGFSRPEVIGAPDACKTVLGRRPVHDHAGRAEPGR
jgi:hypothetical protein